MACSMSTLSDRQRATVRVQRASGRHREGTGRRHGLGSVGPVPARPASRPPRRGAWPLFPFTRASPRGQPNVASAAGQRSAGWGLLPACLPTSTTGRRGEEGGGGEGPVVNAPVRRSATTPLTSLSRPASSLEPDTARATGHPDGEQLLILPLGRLYEPSYGASSKAALLRPGTSLARDAPATARPADGSRSAGSLAGRQARRCVVSSCRRTCVGGPERTRATDPGRRG
jgi:hypothetical protein